MGSIPVAVTQLSDIVLEPSKKLLGIIKTISVCRFTQYMCGMKFYTFLITLFIYYYYYYIELTQ